MKLKSIFLCRAIDTISVDAANKLQNKRDIFNDVFVFVKLQVIANNIKINVFAVTKCSLEQKQAA